MFTDVLTRVWCPYDTGLFLFIKNRSTRAVTNPLWHWRMNMQDPGSSISPLFQMPMLPIGFPVTFWQVEEILAITKFGWVENTGGGTVKCRVVSGFWHWTLCLKSHPRVLLLKYKGVGHFRRNGCPCAEWK